MSSSSRTMAAQDDTKKADSTKVSEAASVRQAGESTYQQYNPSPYGSKVLSVSFDGFHTPYYIQADFVPASWIIHQHHDLNMPRPWLDDIKEDFGHAVIHFLYTKTYQTLPDHTAGEASSDFLKAVRIYRAAGPYIGLQDLRALAFTKIKEFGEKLDYSYILEITRPEIRKYGHLVATPEFLQYLTNKGNVTLAQHPSRFSDHAQSLARPIGSSWSLHTGTKDTQTTSNKSTLKAKDDTVVVPKKEVDELTAELNRKDVALWHAHCEVKRLTSEVARLSRENRGTPTSEFTQLNPEELYIWELKAACARAVNAQVETLAAEVERLTKENDEAVRVATVAREELFRAAETANACLLSFRGRAGRGKLVIEDEGTGSSTDDSVCCNPESLGAAASDMDKVCREDEKQQSSPEPESSPSSPESWERIPTPDSTSDESGSD